MSPTGLATRAASPLVYQRPWRYAENMIATTARIQLTVNGEPLQTAARTLAELLSETGYGDLKVATAINGTFVPAARRTTTRLAAGDHVEVVAPRQGG